MIDLENLDFDMEILRCIGHLEIFKVCREGYFSSLTEKDKFRLYEIYELKNPYSKIVKPLPGYSLLFNFSESEARHRSRTYDYELFLHGNLMFIGIENGKFVFFGKSRKTAGRICGHVSERRTGSGPVLPVSCGQENEREFFKDWLDLNFIKIILTAFSQIMKNSFLKSLSEIDEKDLVSYSLE